MSTLAKLAATAALGFLVGRLSAEPQIRKLRSLLKLALYIAGHDRLTGLPNRFLAAQVFTLRELRAQPTLVALLDLDRFKDINDTHGHHVGDHVLRTVARRLATAAKAHSGTAARLGGDEFLLIFPADGNDHTDSITAIQHTLVQPATITTDDGDITVHASASVGSAVFDGTHGTFNTLLRNADIALYHAKQQSGSHQTYSPDMHMPAPADGLHHPRLRDQHPGNASQATGEVIP